MDKEVKELVEAIKKASYEGENFDVEDNGAGHLNVLYRGQLVMYEEGGKTHPVTLPSTPSDARWRDNTVATLVKAGVLTEDPRKAGQRGLSEEDRKRREAEREQREQKKAETQSLAETTAARAREAQSNTRIVRDRAERVLGKIGVWKPSRKAKGGRDGSVAEAAYVAYDWAAKHAPEVLPPTLVRGRQIFKNLFEGGGMNEASLAFPRAFLDELELSPNPGRRYAELLREQKGITDGAEPVPAAGLGTVEQEREPDEQLDEQPAQEQPVAERLPEPEHAESQFDQPVPKRSNIGERLDALQEQVAAAERARDEALREAQQDADKISELEEALAAARAEAERLAPDAERLRGLLNGNVPNLALEALGEMIGTTIVPQGEEIDMDLMALLEDKKKRAVDIAKRVLALELQSGV